MTYARDPCADCSPRVSVVLVGQNSVDYLSQCLSSLMKTSLHDFEIIYVDNGGSTDGSSKYFQISARGKGRVVQLDRNYGFTLANNAGARLAKGEYIVFLNLDTVVDPGWLDTLVEALENDTTIGAAQPKLLQMNSCLIDSLGGFITPYGTVWSRGYGHRDNEVGGVQNVFFSKGAAMITRRSLWETVGGFDSIFYLYYQETDYCWRLWSMGYRVVCVADSKVWHLGGLGWKRHWGGNYRALVKYYESRERLTLLLKNYSIRRLLRYVPVTVCLHILNTVRFLLLRDPRAAANILKGTVSAFAHFRTTWRRRRNMSADRTSEDYIITRLMIKGIAPVT